MSSAPENTQFNVHNYNIANILKRLEAATVRLEDVSIFQESVHKKTSKEAAGETAGESREEPAGEKHAPVAETPLEKRQFMVAFEAFIRDHIVPFVESSEAIDPQVGTIARALKAGSDEQARFLLLVTRTAKPDSLDPQLLQTLAPINARIEEVAQLKNENRGSPFFNHLSTVAEGALVLGWVVTDTPVSLIPEFKDSAQFWCNRVMKEYRDKDQRHVDWVKLYLALFDALQAYVKQYHSTGPRWNAQGQTLAESLKAVRSGTTPAAGSTSAPPPAPPTPPASLLPDLTLTTTGGINAVFADLNKGSDVTLRLHKVDKSEMTHKNPQLRKEAPVKPLPSNKPTSLRKAENVGPAKSPRKELVDGCKWVIENFTEASAPEPIEITVDKTQSVFIGNTSGVTIVLKGKGNAVSVSETRKTGVIMESLISGIDVIKSFKFGVQMTGVVPLISVDKCDEGSIYMSPESVDAASQVVTSNSSAININVMQGDDFVELPVPEQLSHTIRNGKIVSEVIEHTG